MIQQWRLTQWLASIVYILPCSTVRYGILLYVGEMVKNLQYGLPGSIC